ncbi:MAG: hypothetical protein D3907_01440 [Candidatus Electrothrix sp. AUS3]|nr:hypothetical protein [Candidatus Electrothrix gigas]
MIRSFIMIIGVFAVVFSFDCSYSEEVPFDSEHWDIKAAVSKFGNHLGKECLFFKNGTALVKDSEFKNGIIEFDVTFRELRGFVGVLWRAEDKDNNERFYIRPHQSGNPDAVQYTPVFHGVSGWQLYHGAGYNARFKPRFNEWMHVKILVSDEKADVYVDNMNTPVLVINALKHGIKSGRLGVSAFGEYVGAHFANFKYTRQNNPPLVPRSTEEKKNSPGIIKNWEVSEAFDEKILNDKLTLSENDTKKITWKKITSEPDGIVNISRLQSFVPDYRETLSESAFAELDHYIKPQNCAFAKTAIISDNDQIKELAFGFSDRVKVYLNGQLIYSGNNTYKSRDYRFLGTMGLFDSLYLPLKKGENELLMAVTEESGGWGLQTNFRDMKGISFRK